MSFLESTVMNLNFSSYRELKKETSQPPKTVSIGADILCPDCNKKIGVKKSACSGYLEFKCPRCQKTYIRNLSLRRAM